MNISRQPCPSTQPPAVVSQRPSRWLAAVLVVLLALSAPAATVTCTNLIDAIGVRAGVQRVTFTPWFSGSRVPQKYGNQTVLPQVVAANCDTNSAFSITILAGGLYDATFTPPNSYVSPVRILIPSNDTNTYTLNDVISLATNKNTFIWTNSPLIAPGTNIVFTTNGAMIVINSTASGTTLTNLSGVIEGNPTNNTFSTSGSNIISALAASAIPSGALTNNQTNVTLTGSFTATGGNVVTNGQNYLNLAVSYNVPSQPNTIQLSSDDASVSAVIQAGDISNPFAEGKISFAKGVDPFMRIDSGDNNFLELNSGTLIFFNSDSQGFQFDAGPISGNGLGLNNLQSTNLVGILPMGTLTTLPVVTNGFLTTDGTNRSYSKNAQYLTNVQDSALSTNIARLNMTNLWTGPNTFLGITSMSGSGYTSGGGAICLSNRFSRYISQSHNGGAINFGTTAGATDAQLIADQFSAISSFTIGASADVVISRASAGVCSVKTNLIAQGTITATNGFICPPRALTYSGTNVTVDCSLSGEFSLLLTNHCLLIPTNIVAGKQIHINTRQDAVGTWNIFWTTNQAVPYFKFSGGVIPFNTTNANAEDVISLRPDYNGLNLNAVLTPNFQ